jgi:DNA-binding NarL/FixJ family response regulator
MKVLLVDDHDALLAALKQVIRGLGDDVTVTAVPGTREMRAALKKERDYDLALLDLELKDTDGFAALSELRDKHPGIPVVVVSASQRSSDVIRSIDHGAMGFVPRNASSAMLFDALRLVMSGGIYVPPMTMGGEPMAPAPGGDTVPDVMRQSAPPTRPLPPPEPAAPSVMPAPSLASLGLSPTQMDVLMHLLQGKPNKLIAKELSLSADDVKDEVDAVLRALGVSTRTQAVLAVSQMTQSASNPAWRPSR